MDEGLSRSVTEVFVRLHEEGLIYRGKRLVNWDPKLLTALSDLEVIATEEEGSLWHLRYPLEDGSGHLVVATTRPETLLGDSAVAVHPDDERYQHLVGKRVQPAAGRPADPRHRRRLCRTRLRFRCGQDHARARFHRQRSGRSGMTCRCSTSSRLDARLNDSVPARLRGLAREQARERVLEELTAAGLVERIDKHKLMVPRGDRSGVVLEPLLTDQWYVRIAPLARSGHRGGGIRAHPLRARKLVQDLFRVDEEHP